MKLDKYRGVIPAFYACYDGDGAVSRDAARRLTRYFVEQGVKGVYVGGSSGECIYQSVEDRKKTLEAVMEEGAGRLTVIAHVACNNTKDSQELAAHAAKLGVDAIAAIPPTTRRGMTRLIRKAFSSSSSATALHTSTEIR